jgi:AraC-like DNA-binding protein
MSNAIETHRSGLDDRIIPADMFKLMAWILSERGLRSDRLTKGTGIDLSELVEEEKRTYISFQQSIVLIDNCLALCGDPGFGLALSMRDFNCNFHPLNYAAISSKCGEQALDLLMRYQRVSTFLTIDNLVKTKEDLSFYSTPSYPADRQEPFIIENTFAALAQFPRKIFQDESVHPKAVHLRYREPNYRARYDELFCCPVYFNCPDNRIIWETADIKRPFPAYNPVAVKIAAQFCERLIGHQPGNDLSSKIRLRLMESSGRFPSMEKIADEFGTSVRTLRRSLKENGTTFQNIYDEVRRNLATEYLESSDLTIEYIAELVGFASGGNFYRAFKKWTGKSPTAFRS